jgi:hypothetical protein
MEHEFTKRIKQILKDNFGDLSEKVFSESLIIQYINNKTKSASRGSKSRGSFGNLYAIYVLIEDYIAKGFNKKDGYNTEYEGAIYTNLFKRQRELPFGQKLQNHPLNNRMNDEFNNCFKYHDNIPIPIIKISDRYYFNENLIKIRLGKSVVNLAEAIIQIIDAYIEEKKDAFERFIRFCENAQKLSENEILSFITDLVRPDIDARIFEIVSYSILKYYYHNQVIYWGFERDKITEDSLKLYKTGRTNANDGGIDFVMKPLGRFFQVTETVDVNKYFLDIDKIKKYPITFVVKSSDNISEIRQKIQEQAERQYSIKSIVSKYMECIEEIINVPTLLEGFRLAVEQGHLNNILNEIINQSKVEFNFEDDEDISNYEDNDLSE